MLLVPRDVVFFFKGKMWGDPELEEEKIENDVFWDVFHARIP